jgi:hypothetical protein
MDDDDDDDNECGAVNGVVGMGNLSTWSKAALVPVFPPQIPHHMTWSQVRAATVGSQHLTSGSLL